MALYLFIVQLWRFLAYLDSSSGAVLFRWMLSTSSVITFFLLL